MSRKIPKITANLEQNYPNPFKKETTIFYTVSLAKTCKISLKIMEEDSYNEVKTLVNARQKKGRYEVRWDGTNEEGEKLPKGVYVCKLLVGNFQESRKIILDR